MLLASEEEDPEGRASFVGYILWTEQINLEGGARYWTKLHCRSERAVSRLCVADRCCC